MGQDYSKEVKVKINEFKEKGFEFGKSEKYLSHRAGISFKEMEAELENCKDLVFADRRDAGGEVRYTLYFVYNKRKGRAYAITFRGKIRVITAFPLGRKTLNKYNRQRFKKSF